MDVVSIVEKLNAMGLIRTHKKSGDWYQCYCPFHSDGNEKKPSFGILLVNQQRNGQSYPVGFSHCFACGFAAPLKKTIEEILKRKSVTPDIVNWLQENIPEVNPKRDEDKLIDPSLTDAITSTFVVNDLKRRMQGAVQYVSEEELASYRFTVPYMYERKLTDEIIEKFDVGFDANWIPPGRKKPVPCISFPVHDTNGKVLFFCRRSVEGKIYNYPQGVTKPLYGIYHIPNGCKSVIVCESIINALTLWTWGYVAVALMGTGNTYQMTQLKRLGVNEIIICMDGDDAGRRATEKLRNQLRQVCLVTRVRMLDGKDVNDIDKETFEKLYKERY